MSQIRTGLAGHHATGKDARHEEETESKREGEREGENVGPTKSGRQSEIKKGLEKSRCCNFMSVLCDGGQTGRVSDHAFVLQLCLGGLGLQAWRLQQETLWFGGAGESRPQCTRLFVRLSPHPLSPAPPH